VSTETIPDLLARLEREHVPDPKYPELCLTCYEQWLWPCDTAKLVAHARSLDAWIRNHAMDHPLGMECAMELVDMLDIDLGRAALGEAQ
jgi:hypothetical protein